MQTGDAKYAICAISHDESNFPPHIPNNEKLTMFMQTQACIIGYSWKIF